MDVVYRICCGLDVGQREVAACLRRALGEGRVEKEHRTFETTLSGLSELSTWLRNADCKVVAMESTGVYWKPIYHVLNGSCRVVLGNAREIRQRPGKKTDKSDADWISELLAHGLITPSFVPPPEVAALRDLTRTRVSLIENRTQTKNRIHKILEDTNIKLSSVVSDLFGKSARSMLDALVRGERDPQVLAKKALGRLKAKIPELELALEGNFSEHHATLIRLSLELIDTLNDQISRIDVEIGKIVEPMRQEIAQLASIPGVDVTAARQIIAETGIDMSRFQSASRLSSWAGVCPGNNESAGKRKSGKTRKGSKWLRRVLVQCAWAARQTTSHVGHRFRRLEKRIGGKKAAMAVAHQILVIIWQLLSHGTHYEESRYACIDQEQEARRLKKLIKSLEPLGYKVTIESAA